MNLNIVKVIAAVLLILTYFTPNVFAQDLVIFSKNNLGKQSTYQCGEDVDPNAISYAKINNNQTGISWRYDKKIGSWCAWETNNLPSDITQYLDGFLVIKFIGTYDDLAPRVNFLGPGLNKTQHKDFGPRMTGDPATGATVRIPMSLFFINDDPDFNAFPPTKVRSLQINANWYSKWGRITFTYIGLEKKK